ncbi:phage portal protein [Bacillus altitudinis]|uniref:phage portal protein n=1 Tax=Bacillus altitudinis TaxID=293387 RepID=UPI0024A7F9AF|nr:phage portal protein [Bacillus altitudinis]MDI6647764.1 phage portal protein [Bacillus altitudinis]MDI6662387.1 phage portal protein [Bacillus altitudinis]
MAFFRSINQQSTGQREFNEILVGLDGLSYVPATAIKNSDVFTAVHVLSSDIAASPIMIRNNGIEEKDSDLFQLINERPNEYYSGYSFKYILVANALFNGQSFAYIKRDKDGTPWELIHMLNSEVSVDQVKGRNDIVYRYYPADGKEAILKPTDVLHIKFSSLDGVNGKSLLSCLKHELESQEAGKRLVTDFFRRGTNLSGIVNLKKGIPSPEARENLRKEFEKVNSGARNQQRIAVLSENEEFKQLEISTKVLEIVNNYTHSTKQIAKVFGLPPHKLGIEQVNTSLEQANLDYLTNTLSNYFAAITAELNFKMLFYPESRTKRFQFDARRFKETDAKTKRENVIALLQNGIYSQNDALAEYGIAPIENGDRRFMSLNFVDVDIMDEIQKAKAKGLPIPSLDKGGDDIGKGD